MKVREIMTKDPVCCLASDTAQRVARVLKENGVGSVPVISDKESRKLVGMITDRDLCLGILAEGRDAKTPIQGHFSANPVSCREGENIAACEKLMQEHQVRRMPIVDGEGRVIGIVAQADLALKEKPEKVKEVVAEISKPSEGKVA